MKLTDIDVYRMSNLADWKLKEHIKTFKHKAIIVNDILIRARKLEQEARFNRNTLLTQKYEDLIESVTEIQKELQTTV